MNVSPSESESDDCEIDEYHSTVEALRKALADMAAGDLGTPLHEFDKDFCARHALSPMRQ